MRMQIALAPFADRLFYIYNQIRCQSPVYLGALGGNAEIVYTFFCTYKYACLPVFKLLRLARNCSYSINNTHIMQAAAVLHARNPSSSGRAPEENRRPHITPDWRGRNRPKPFV